MTTMRKVIVCKFEPGDICATPGVLAKVGPSYGVACLERHLNGDWGAMCDEDKELNDLAVKGGSRIISVYPLPDDPANFWIITEADRSFTTFLLPEEY